MEASSTVNTCEDVVRQLTTTTFPSLLPWLSGSEPDGCGQWWDVGSVGTRCVYGHSDAHPFLLFPLRRTEMGHLFHLLRRAVAGLWLSCVLGPTRDWGLLVRAPKKWTSLAVTGVVRSCSETLESPVVFSP